MRQGSYKALILLAGLGFAACKNSTGAGSPGDAACAGSGGCGTSLDANSPDDARSSGNLRADTSNGTTDATVGTLCPSTGKITEAAGPLPYGVHVVSDMQSSLPYYAFTGDSYVYWAPPDRATILRISLTDGSNKVLFDDSSSGVPRIQGLAADANGLYFLESGVGVGKISLDGSGSTATLSAAKTVGEIVAGGDSVYYFDYDQQSILRVPTNGGAATPLIRNVDPFDLWVADGHLYFLHPRSATNLYLLLRVSVDSVAPNPDAGSTADSGAGQSATAVPAGAEQVATAGGGANGPVTDHTNVYWAESHKLMYVPLAGGTAQVLATADSTGQYGGDPIAKIVPFNGLVYWSTRSESGHCARVYVSSATSPKSVLVPAVAAALASVTSSYVYLLGAEILRMPR